MALQPHETEILRSVRKRFVRFTFWNIVALLAALIFALDAFALSGTRSAGIEVVSTIKAMISLALAFFLFSRWGFYGFSFDKWVKVKASENPGTDFELAYLATQADIRERSDHLTASIERLKLKNGN